MPDKLVNFSTTLNWETKELLDRYCKTRGLRINHFVETAILEKLEDEMDADIINKREFEETVAWKKKA